MQQYRINAANGVAAEEFTAGAVFVNLWKCFSWFLLMLLGVFICCMPWLAASFDLVLPTIFAGVAFPAMLVLGLTIVVPSLMLTVASVLHIFHKRGLAKLIKNIALSAMALAALTIGILLFAAPGLPIISAFAGMISELGSLGALLTKISLIALGACKVLDVGWDFGVGSERRIIHGAIGKDVQKPGFWTDNAVICALMSAVCNLPKILRNLAIIALGIVVCCKLSLAVGLIFAIPFGLKLVTNFLDKNGNALAHRIAKCLNNLVKGAFGAASLFMGISFFQPAVLVGFLGKLSFISAAFPGVVGLVAGISLIAFGVFKLAKVVTDIICGDKEKLKQGVYEIKTSVSEKTKNKFAKIIANILYLEKVGDDDSKVPQKTGDINTIVPDLVFAEEEGN